jgi:formylglycine-generating enzyme required for sulfatase activity
VGASTGSGRVVRGGNWGSNAVNCRVSNCNYSNPYYRFIFYGFRVVVFAI